MKKIATIIGARPQFIKAAALSHAIQHSSEFTEVLIHTGQHYDSNMSDVFFNELNIPKPDYQLNINNASHGEMTGRMLIEIEKILQAEMPDVVLVYGDTNSTLAAALAAKKLKLKIAHVEAGLRSFNMDMPEEINRIITDRLSDFLFCPTDAAMDNLVAEGYEHFHVELIRTGDIMLDTVMLFKKMIDSPPDHANTTPFVVATIHREENTNNVIKLATIVEALNVINSKVRVVLPLHPRTRKILSDNNLSFDFEVIDPVGYVEMMRLLQNCELVITDSGGLQKEAYFFGKKCLTLRDQTEWTELVAGGYNILSPVETNAIVQNFQTLYSREVSFVGSLYGDGHAAGEILAAFSKYLY